jgi:hypothetical protein
VRSSFLYMLSLFVLCKRNETNTQTRAYIVPVLKPALHVNTMH